MNEQSERGGFCAGAGRKPGSRNRQTLACHALLASEAAKGMTPLEFGLRILRGETISMRGLDEGTGEVVERLYSPTFKDRQWAAEMTAPYIHPELANIAHSGNVAVRHEDFIEQLMKEESTDG
jgi:hypothetical protein